MTDKPIRIKNSRLVAILVVIIIILAGLGVYSHHKQKAVEQPATPTAQQGQTSGNQTLLPSPKTISAFTLTDDTGKPFTNDSLKGHWSFVAFGFSHCGDVCPITLTELNKMVQQLQKDLPADKLPQVVFISVDPERDTTAVLHNYVKNYNPSFIGATGSTDNLNIFVKDLGVYYSKKPSNDPKTYGMNHSSQLYLFNPDGNWVGIVTYPFQADQLTKNYEAMIHEQPK